jgi:hypothetical protein
MTSSTGNIEPIARDICARQFARHGAHGVELATDVDRFWHCVASEMEAGRIDDDGNLMPAPNHDERLKAYRDWYLESSSLAVTMDRYRHLFPSDGG